MGLHSLPGDTFLIQKLLDRAGAFVIKDMVIWLVARDRDLVVDTGKCRHHVRIHSQHHGAHKNIVNFVNIGNTYLLHFFV